MGCLYSEKERCERKIKDTGQESVGRNVSFEQLLELIPTVEHEHALNTHGISVYM